MRHRIWRFRLLGCWYYSTYFPVLFWPYLRSITWQLRHFGNEITGGRIRPCYRSSISVLLLCRFLPTVARRSVVALWLVPKLPRRPVHAWPPKLPTRLDVSPIDWNLWTCTCTAYSSDYTLAVWWKCAYTARNRIIARHTSDVKIPQGSTLLSLWVIFCVHFFT